MSASPEFHGPIPGSAPTIKPAEAPRPKIKLSPVDQAPVIPSVDNGATTPTSTPAQKDSDSPPDGTGPATSADSDQDIANSNEAGDANNEDGKVIMQEITKTMVELAGDHILNAKLESFKKIIAGKSSSEVDAIRNADPEMHALNELYWAQLDSPGPIPKEGANTIVDLTQKGPSGSAKDVEIGVTSVTNFKDGKFTCQANVDGTGQEITLTRDEMQTALLAKDTNLKAILASLPEGQREAFQLYVDMKKNGGILPAGTSQEEAQRMLAESAESIGLITGEDLKMMLNSHFSHLIGSAGVDVAKIQKLEELHKSILEDEGLNLDGVVIADGSILARIFARTGAVSPQSIDLVIDSCSQDIAKIRIKLEDKKLPVSERKELEKELVTVELQKKLTTASKGAVSEDEVSKSLDLMMKSGVDLKSFRDAVRTADTDTVIDFIFKNNPSLEQVSDEIKHKHRQELARKLGKTGGLAALAMAIMMYTAMKGGDKAQ